MKLVKKNGETGEALAYVPFRITNTETGETHYILTDENGSFNSANHKTENTNANDAVLSKYGDHDVIPQSVINSLKRMQVFGSAVMEVPQQITMVHLFLELIPSLS